MSLQIQPAAGFSVVAEISSVMSAISLKATVIIKPVKLKQKARSALSNQNAGFVVTVVAFLQTKKEVRKITIKIRDDMRTWQKHLNRSSGNGTLKIRGVIEGKKQKEKKGNETMMGLSSGSIDGCSFIIVQGLIGKSSFSLFRASTNPQLRLQLSVQPILSQLFCFNLRRSIPLSGSNCLHPRFKVFTWQACYLG